MVFLKGEGHHVADPPVTQIAGMAVMDRMGAPPDIVGRQGDDAERPPDPVADIAVSDEGAVAAIVLDAEEAHEEQAVDRRDQEGAEIAVARDPAGKDPQEDEAHDADGEFEAASHHIWFAVFRQDLNPVARGGGICAVGVMSHRR